MKLIKFTMIISAFLLIGCTCKNDTSSVIKSSETIINNNRIGTVMLYVKIKTKLSEEELLRIAKERAPEFEVIPGLIEKYYVKTKNSGEYGGVYIWDSMESLKKYKESNLAATIAKAYNLIEPPTLEVVDIMFELRE